MCSGCVCAHFKGVYARYWIPEGDAPQRGMRQRTGHRRKGFSSPEQSNSGDRTHVCGLIGHIHIPQPSSSPPLYRGIWGFWSGHDYIRRRQWQWRGRHIKYNMHILRKFSLKIISYTYACNIITRCYLCSQNEFW